MRKEKGSKFSQLRFDGLFVGGRVQAQEWLVVEVSRTPSDNVAKKQRIDRSKVIAHSKIMACVLRDHVVNDLGLCGDDAVETLRKLPVWGIICQGLKIEILKFVWITLNNVALFAYAGEVPAHIEHLPEIYPLLKQIYFVKVCSILCMLPLGERHANIGAVVLQTQIAASVQHWNSLHSRIDTI